MNRDELTLALECVVSLHGFLSNLRGLGTAKSDKELKLEQLRDKFLKQLTSASDQDWIPGQDGCVELHKHGEKLDDAPLPAMGECVECLMFDGHNFVAWRTESFESGCGWMWATGTGWLVAGHPLLICWRPIEREATDAKGVSENG